VHRFAGVVGKGEIGGRSAGRDFGHLESFV
jgi:hypothetical protein